MIVNGRDLSSTVKMISIIAHFLTVHKVQSGKVYFRINNLGKLLTKLRLCCIIYAMNCLP